MMKRLDLIQLESMHINGVCRGGARNKEPPTRVVYLNNLQVYTNWDDTCMITESILSFVESTKSFLQENEDLSWTIDSTLFWTTLTSCNFFVGKSAINNRTAVCLLDRLLFSACGPRDNKNEQHGWWDFLRYELSNLETTSQHATEQETEEQGLAA